MTNDTGQGYTPFDLFPYNPAQPPAFAFVALFGIVAVLHLAAMIPYRCFFPIPLIIGGGMEAGGYYFRSQSHDDVRRTLPFIIQNLLILAAPPFLAASIFMSPRRIARALDEEGLVLMRKLASKLFVMVDVACLGTQVAGAIMSGSENPDEAHRGETIIIAGLVVQIISFCFFAVWAGSLHWRLRARDGSRIVRLHWRRSIIVLCAISVLFIIRSVTRIIEYRQGSDGEMLSNEVYLYVLDGAVMLAITILFLIFHPGRIKFQVRRLADKGYGYMDDEIHLHRVESIAAIPAPPPLTVRAGAERERWQN